MTSTSEPGLGAALRDLVDVPAPVDLADAALARARRLRARRVAAGAGVALAVAGLVAVPFVLRPGAQVPGPTHAGLTRGPTTPEPCVTLTESSEETSGVPEAEWPRFVRIAIGKLPRHTEYRLEYAYGICPPRGSLNESAYAVIGVGPAREQGHLTLNLLARHPSDMPTTCAAARESLAAEPNADTVKQDLRFCEDASGDRPFVVGVVFDGGSLGVVAVYPDRRAVSMESHPPRPGAAPGIGVDTLRAVVTDPALVDLIPVTNRD